MSYAVRFQLLRLRLLLNGQNYYRKGLQACGAPGRDHGGIRNKCLLRSGHWRKHRDMWGDKWAWQGREAWEYGGQMWWWR